MTLHFYGGDDLDRDGDGHRDRDRDRDRDCGSSVSVSVSDSDSDVDACFAILHGTLVDVKYIRGCRAPINQNRSPQLLGFQADVK